MQKTYAIVDNDPLVLAVMRNVLSKLLPSEYACKWCVKSGVQALKYCQVAKTTPDYILIDMSMKDMSGVDVIRAIREQNNSIILIGMTSYDCRSYASMVSQVGGQAMVAKDNFKGLAEALQYCDKQNVYGCRCVKDVVYDFATPQESFIRLSKSRSRSVLPPQELKIMDLLTKGYTTNQIAAQLGLMPNTINTHIHRIYKKLHVSNRVQAISAFAAMQNREQDSNIQYFNDSPQNHPNFLQETDNAC
ncbi:response regulator transcription factor [Gardnerella sp. KA00747]|uniref:response regulator transcription factor n=1 Tax=Gardnerella sp. KA00747 TaxID=2749078 RepID=UPI003BA900E6